jgi:hypothetical protein
VVYVQFLSALQLSSGGGPKFDRIEFDTRSGSFDELSIFVSQAQAVPEPSTTTLLVMAVAAGEHPAVATARIVGHHPVQAPELTAGARLHLEWMNPPIAHGEVADFRRAAPHLHLQIRDAIHLFCFFSGGYDWR